MSMEFISYVSFFLHRRKSRDSFRMMYNASFSDFRCVEDKFMLFFKSR